MILHNTARNGAQWFAIRTKPHAEQIARLNYQQQGYSVYLPLFKALIRHARQTKEVLKPIFPGYLFLHLAPEQQNWVAIAFTRGVIGPVRFGDQYVPVPDWVIDGLKDQEESPGILSATRVLSRQFPVGSIVAVELGNGIMTEGTIFSIEGDKNVVVLLDLLQRRIKTTIPLALVSERG